MKNALRLLIVLTAFNVSACSVFPQEHVRARLSITIAGDNFSQTQSSVSEVQWIFYPSPFGISRHVRGRALLFDLGPSGQLVAALEPHRPGRIVNVSSLERAIAYSFGGFEKYTNLWQPQLKVISEYKGEAKIAKDYLPQFIWFPNPRDPWNSTLLEPSELAKITPGLQVTDATLSTTQDRVDLSYSPEPPWLVELGRGSRPPPGMKRDRYSIYQISGS